MEKVTFAPLATHLHEQRDYYNQLYLDHELKYGPVDPLLLQQWIVCRIQPVVKAVADGSPHSIAPVFKAFYTALLPLAGSGWLVTWESEYQRLWKLCEQVPSLVATAPSKVLKALHSALKEVSAFQSSRTMKWMGMMEQTIACCTSLDDLLHCGRFTAWFCGLAHLRERCCKAIPNLPVALVEALEKASPLSLSLKTVCTQVWPAKGSPRFIEGAGGFTGLDGTFLQVPELVHQGGSYTVASDGVNSYLLFADVFGSVLLPHNERYNTYSEPSIQDFKTFQRKYGKEIVPFNDVVSCVVKDTTLFLTRSSSHYIYIYGWSDGN